MDKKKSGEPKVEIFGRSLGEDEKCCEEGGYHFHWHEHHHHAGSVLWGIFFLWAGIILLCNTLTIIPWSFWTYTRSFWPIVLVLIGIRVVLGRNFISRLIVFVIALVVLTYITIYALDVIHSPFVNNVPPNLLNSVRSSIIIGK